MTDTRIFPCACCGGDGGFDVPHGIDYRDGDLLTHWVECRPCDGTGDMEIEFVPVTLEDIEAVPA